VGVCTAEDFKAKAVVTTGEERERLFNAQDGQMPVFKRVSEQDRASDTRHRARNASVKRRGRDNPGDTFSVERGLS
jgi:hypothetical protein